MCIILACEGGKRPTAQVIENCWLANPDGAGIMWADGTVVHGVKGLMELDELTAELAGVPADAPLVIHFRIGTSGGLDGRVTHPYPISRDVDDLHALKWESPVGIAHNGVMRNMAIDTPKGISDTVAFIRDVAAPLAECFDLFDTDATNILEAATDGNRLCILGASGRFNLSGYGWNEVTDGVMASNTSWRGFTYKTWPKPKKTAKKSKKPAKGRASDGCANCACLEECSAECPWCYEVALELGYTLEEWSEKIDLIGAC